MQSEEEKRRLELYKQQIPRFVVQTGPSRTPKPTAQPNIPIKVSQPKTPVTPVSQPQQPAQDRRPLWSKLYDQVNPFDAGRTFTNAGPSTDLNWAQRNINMWTGPKIVKDVAQGFAQIPIVATQSAGEITKKLASNKDAERALAMPFEQRKAIISASKGNWLTDRNNPLNFYNPNYAVAKFFQETGIEPTDENIKKYIQGQEEYKKQPIVFQPKSRAQRMVFGIEPVTSYQEQGKVLTQLGSEKLNMPGLSKLATPLAIGLFALDIPTGGKASTLFTRIGLRQLVKAGTVDEVTRLAEKQGVKLALEEAEALAKAGTQKEVKAIVKQVEERILREADQQVVKNAAQKALETATKAVPTPTATVTAEQVKNLLQGLPETSRTQFADEIARATSPEQIQEVITRIENAKQSVAQAIEGQVPEALPVTPIQRQQEALIEAVQQPTAPTQAIPTPTVTPEAPTPRAVQGAVEPQDVWEAEYVPQLETIDNQINGLRNELNIARGQDKARIQAQIDALNKQSAELENNFLSRFGRGEAAQPAQAVTPPPSRFAIRETPEQTIARLKARQAEVQPDQGRLRPIDIVDQQYTAQVDELVKLDTTNFVERLGELTGISPKWTRRALEKGYDKRWVYYTAMDSIKSAEDVNKVFNYKVKNIKLGVLPAEKNLSELIGKKAIFKDGTVGKVLDTNKDNTRIQVEMPDGSVRVDVKKSDLQPNGVIEKEAPEVIRQEIPELPKPKSNAQFIPYDDMAQATDVYDEEIMNLYDKKRNGFWVDRQAWANDEIIAPRTTPIELPKTVKVDGNIVNTTTGEILEPPVNTLNELKAIPDYDKATIQDFDNILRVRDLLKERFDQWAKTFSPEELEYFKEEMYLVAKGDIPLSDVSPKTQNMYDEIKPLLDEMYNRDKRVLGKEIPELGRFPMYMSQQRKASGFSPKVEFGYSTIDKANTTFGSAERRMFLNEVEDIKDPLTGYKDYVDQWIYDNYNQVATASKPEYANTYVDPVKYLNDEEKIIERLAVKADEQVADIKKSVEPSDTMIIDEVTENFKKHALPEIKKEQTIEINGRMPRGAIFLEDREILQGLGVYDRFGFKAYDEAYITGAQIFEDNFADIAKMNREQIQERLTQLYAKQFTEMPESTDYVIRKRANSIFNDLNNSRKNVEMGLEPEVNVPAYHFAKLERDLAAAKIYYNLQRSVIKDEKVKKLLNRQLERTLTDGRRIETFGEKVLNQIGETLHAAMLGLKIPTAVQNLTESLRLTGILDNDILKQLAEEAVTGKLKVKETLQRISQDKSVLKQLSDIPTNQKRITASNLLDKSRNVAMAGFDFTEGIKDTMFLRGFELQGRKRGLSGRELGQYIAENYNRYAFKGGQFGSLGFNQNPVGRLLFQFSQYPIKQIKLNSKYAKQALSTDPVVRKEALRYLGKTFGSNAAVAALLYPIFGWGMQRAIGADLPKFGPSVSLTVELYNVINDELERVNTENNRLAESGSDERVGYNWENVLDRWGRKVAAYPIPGGDWLFNKLGVGEFLPDGFNPFSKNTTIATWQRGYEENYKGQARIEGPQNWYDYATQAIGGQYNTAAARGYFGTRPISFTIDIPGTAKDIRIFSKERLQPLNKAEQQYFEKLPTAEAKRDFLTQKHKKTKLYQDLKKEFGENLDNAIYGPTYTNTKTGERTVLDSKEKSIEKARLLLNVPGLLEAVNMLNAENPLPIKDPFLNLIPEHQKEFLRYQASEGSDKRAIYERNKDWMQEFMDARDPYYAQFEITGEEKKRQKDRFGLMPPELTNEIKSLRDRFFKLDGWEARQKYLEENPSLNTYLKEKDQYDRDYNTLSYRPNVDPYPEPDAETQQYLDEYTASGPAATEGRKAVERSAWIKANPEKWKKVQAFFTETALWSLQNELALSVYEGIEPSEKAFERIQSIAKGMGLGQFQFGTGTPTAEDLAFRSIYSNLELVSARGIGLAPLPAKRRKPARFRVQVPSARRTQQIRLR